MGGVASAFVEVHAFALLGMGQVSGYWAQQHACTVFVRYDGPTGLLTKKTTTVYYYKLPCTPSSSVATPMVVSRGKWAGSAALCVARTNRRHLSRQPRPRPKQVGSALRIVLLTSTMGLKCFTIRSARSSGIAQANLKKYRTQHTRNSAQSPPRMLQINF